MGEVLGGAVPEMRALEWTCTVESPRGAAVKAQPEEVALAAWLRGDWTNGFESQKAQIELEATLS